MAIVAMWKCDRDGSMFADKKEAEAYDKMLELAEGFATLIGAKCESISEADAEAIGLLLSQHKDEVLAACKGKPDALTAISAEEAAPAEDKTTKSKGAVITPIAKKG